jgi:putative flippase GtrA
MESVMRNNEMVQEYLKHLNLLNRKLDFKFLRDVVARHVALLLSAALDAGLVIICLLILNHYIIESLLSGVAAIVLNKMVYCTGF